MNDATPRHLPALIRWYISEVKAEMPTRLHSRETSEDGHLEWHRTFRTWMFAHPGATDADGNVRFPVRYWLWVWEGKGREKRVKARFLLRLGQNDGDWEAAVRAITPLTEDGEIVARTFALKALQDFWEQMQSVPMRSVRDKSEAQHRAEESI